MQAELVKELLEKLRIRGIGELTELAKTLVDSNQITVRDFAAFPDSDPDFMSWDVYLFNDRLAQLVLETGLMIGEERLANLVKQGDNGSYHSSCVDYFLRNALRKETSAGTNVPSWLIEGAVTIVIAVYDYIYYLDNEAKKAKSSQAV